MADWPSLQENLSSWFVLWEINRGHEVQSVTCLTVDTSLTADPGVASSILAQSHSFLEIHHEMITTTILLPSADSRRVCNLYSMVTWCINWRRLLSLIIFQRSSLKWFPIIQRLAIHVTLMYCNRLHAWWSTQSLLATLLSSLIARQWL